MEDGWFYCDKCNSGDTDSEEWGLKKENGYCSPLDEWICGDCWPKNYAEMLEKEEEYDRNLKNERIAILKEDLSKFLKREVDDNFLTKLRKIKSCSWDKAREKIKEPNYEEMYEK